VRHDVAHPGHGRALLGVLAVSAETIGRGPTVLRFGDVLMLTGQSVVDAHLVFELGMREARRDGITATRLDPLRAAYAATAAEVRARSPRLPHDVPAHGRGTQSDRQQLVGTTEVAIMLGVTRRHAARLAGTLDGQLYRGTWLFDLATVETYAAGRNEVAA
jgi:hypothetical protein